jgi:hypothetical protein
MREKRQRLIALARRWRKSIGNPITETAGLKKQIRIEALLHWTYFDELPKGQDCCYPPFSGFKEGWASIAEFGNYLSVIDNGVCNLWGALPAFDRRGGPHEDALAVVKAVEALDEKIVDLPPQWDPFSDLPSLGSAGDEARAKVVERIKMQDGGGASKLRIKPSALVFNYAILGGCPPWEIDTPSLKHVCGFNGKPKWFIRKTEIVNGVPFEIETNGCSSAGRRPAKGSYHKHYLDPDPVEAGIARAEYEIWRTALNVLVATLADSLSSYVVLPSELELRPWENTALAPNRILPDLGGALVG